MPRRRHKRVNSSSQYLKVETEGPCHLPYLVKHSDNLGRYLVASCDLPEGAEIISEDPLVVGPAQDSQPVCLGCCMPVLDLDTSIRCAKCFWPICSSNCKGLNRRLGHSETECKTLSKCNVRSSTLPLNQLYNAIVPLRCLLLAAHIPDDWKTLMSMEAHNETRKQIPTIWEYNQKSVVNRISHEWKIENYSEEDIHTVCGILEVNCFAVGDELMNMRGLYPTSYLVAHSCTPNTSHTDDDHYHMKLFSSVPIKKNELITLSYTNSLQGTRNRREHLKQCKFFECECARCKDPTELGTYLSALKCKECRSGYLLSSNPLSTTAIWICDNKKCSKTLPVADVDSILNRIDKEVKATENGSINQLENRLENLSKILHKNHYYILGIKYTLSQLYGKSAGYLIHDMTEAMLERKRNICEDILSVFNILEPGLSSIRGLTMYELHAPIMVLTIQQFHMRKISKVDLCRRLRKVAFYLQECIRILKFEANNTKEGCIRVAAEDAMSQLKSWESVVGKF